MVVADQVRAVDPVSLFLGKSTTMSGNISIGQGPGRKQMGHLKGNEREQRSYLQI